jgi:hypothetical protein
MKKSYSLILALTFLITWLPTSQADTQIDTTGNWFGGQGAGTLGNPAFSPTFGQTFTAPSDNVLTNFTVYTRATFGASLHARAYVYAWDGNSITGPALFTGGPLTLTNPSGSSSFTEVPTATNVVLNAGSQYVFMMTILGEPASSGSAVFGLTSSDPYGGGGHWQSNSTTIDDLGVTNWNSFGGLDLAFKADFQAEAVPEPSTWVMLLGGLSFLGLWMTRRKDAATRLA